MLWFNREYLLSATGGEAGNTTIWAGLEPSGKNKTKPENKD